MSHYVDSLAYTGDVPWHGLGEYVGTELNANGWLKKGGLDWEVIRCPQTYLFNGKKMKSDFDAIVREDTGVALTYATKTWNLFQNRMGAEFLEEFLVRGNMSMEVVGALKKGAQVFFLAKVKEEFQAVKGDHVQSYLLFSIPHAYGKAMNVRFTPTRVVCWNTFAMAMNGQADLEISINHRREFDAEMAEKVKETLGIAHNKLENYQSMAKFLAGKRFTPENVINYFKTVFPLNTQNKSKTGELSLPAKVAIENLDTQPGAKFGEGTYWQAFNAVTYVIDHKLGNGQDTRLYSAWYGTNRQRKILAAKTAVEFAEAA